MIRLVCIGCKWMYCTFISNHANPWLSYCIKLVQIIYRYICLLVNASAFWTNRYELANIHVVCHEPWHVAMHMIGLAHWAGKNTYRASLWLGWAGHMVLQSLTNLSAFLLPSILQITKNRCIQKYAHSYFITKCGLKGTEKEVWIMLKYISLYEGKSRPFL